MQNAADVRVCGSEKQASADGLEYDWRQRPNGVSHRVRGVSHPACHQPSSPAELSPTQLRLCRLNPDHMDSVGDGVRLATDECRYQTQWRRWNCSTSPGNASIAHSTAVRGQFRSP